MSPSKAALEKFTKELEKRHEGASIRDLSAGPPEVVPTGSLSLDYALGCGGWVKGRVVELWGREQTGKSTMLTISVAEFQRQVPDRMAAWIDVEGTFDLEWARGHGANLDPSRFLLIQPGNAEEVADLTKELINATDGGDPMFGFITLDSVGAMITQTEKDKDADEVTMAANAKVVTRMVKIASADMGQTGAVLAIINQVRANLAYGGDLTRTGGFALSHVTTHRVQFKRTGTKPYMIGGKGAEEQVGQEIAMFVEKNKVAPPKRTAMATFWNQTTEKYGPMGLDVARDVFNTARNIPDVFGRRGAWFDLPDGSKHNGEDAVVTYLRENTAAREAIREKVLATRAHEVITDPIKEG
jgi:recombination protein RecA